MTREKVAWKFYVWPLCLCVLLAALCLPSPTQAAGTTTVTTWQGLKDAIAAGTATNIQISGELVADSTITITNSNGVTLSKAADPAVGTIKRDSGFTDYLFNVGQGGVLILDGVTLDGNQEPNSNSLIAVFGGNLTLKSGRLTGNTAAVYGGAVYMEPNNASFTMEGGEISNNSAGVFGGAVYIGTGDNEFTENEFTMKGGKISNNSAQYGGAVYVTKNSGFTLVKGEISKNTAQFGGGVHVLANGVFEMQDEGVLCENEATGSGGGVFLDVGGATYTGGKFTMKGGQISKNKAVFNGGGINMNPFSAFNMEGGQISGNQAVGSPNGDSGGGGVIMLENSTFTMTDGKIVNNKATFGGGLVVASSSFTMEGGQISENQAVAEASDVLAYNTFTVSGTPVIGKEGDGGVYLLPDQSIAVGTGGLKDGSRINLETVEEIAKGTVVAKNDAGATQAEAAYFHYLPGGYVLRPQGKNYTLIPFYHITASSEGHGSITPAGTFKLEDGDSQSFTFTPESGYEVDKVLLDGTPVTPAGNQYTLANVTKDHSLRVSFKLKSYTVAASAGDHGSISPTGSVEVSHGSSQRFTFTPESGYEVDKVLLDGTPITPVGNQYTLTNVTKEYSLHVSFKLKSYTVTASAGTHGSISPTGSIEVSHGGSLSFTLTPESGYVVDKVLLNGMPVTHTSGRYTLTNVTQNHTLYAAFTRGIVISANEEDVQRQTPALKQQQSDNEQPGEEDGKPYRTISTLNIRSGPGTDYDELGKLKAGQAVKVLHIADGWAKIAYEGGADGTAYVSAQYLLSLSGAQPQGLYQVTARTLHVRQGAGTKYAIVGKLRRGDKVETLEAVLGGGWYRISYGGRSAYISANYVTEVS